MIPFLTPLTIEQLRSAGVPEPWTFGFADRVRFGEIDVLGHVNNTVYLRWFENLRVQYFRHRIEPVGGARPNIVLRNIGLDFKREILPNSQYIVTGRTTEVRNTSFTQTYAVWVDGVLCTTGHAVIVNVQDKVKAPLDAKLKSALVTLDGAEQL